MHLASGTATPLGGGAVTLPRGAGAVKWVCADGPSQPPSRPLFPDSHLIGSSGGGPRRSCHRAFRLTCLVQSGQSTHLTCPLFRRRRGEAVPCMGGGARGARLRARRQRLRAPGRAEQHGGRGGGRPRGPPRGTLGSTLRMYIYQQNYLHVIWYFLLGMF